MVDLPTKSGSKLTIQLNKEDLHIVEEYQNFVLCGQGMNVISTTNKGTTRSLARILLNYAGSDEIDHKDKNWKNFKRDNLRIATRQQQMANSYPQGLRDYKGVYKIRDGRKLKNPFRAVIKVNQKRINLGYYPTEEQAALVYNEAAVKYFGEFAYLNKVE